MLKTLGITSKFIAIISMVTLLLVAAIAFIMVKSATQFQYNQAQFFLGSIKSEQAEEEKALRQGLIQKGEAIANLLAQAGAPKIIGYDFQSLEQLANSANSDGDIAFVAFFDKDEKPITKEVVPQDQIEIIKKDILLEKELVGFVRIGLNFNSINENMKLLSSRVENLAQQTDQAMLEASRGLTYRVIWWAVLGICLLCLVTYGALLFIIIKPVNRIVARLKEGANYLADASVEVSSCSQSLVDRETEQASSLQETSSSLEEMASMSQQNADHAHQANNLMEETQKVVIKANTSMKDLRVAMEQITEASHQTARIIKTIDEIAFQTNLLALNAAVEAARAGDAGLGFAVVADEVRNLALRAAEAARNTQQIIEENLQNIQSGSQLVLTTDNDFNQVEESSHKVAKLLEEISAASREQAQGVNQINKAVSTIDELTQKNSSHTQKSVSIVSELSTQAEHLQGIVYELMSLVEGNRKTSDTPQLFS